MWRLLQQGGLADFWQKAAAVGIQLDVAYLLLSCALATAMIAIYLLTRSRPVYLLGYHVYKAPEMLKMSTASFLKLSRDSKAFNQQSLEFQEKLVARGGLGEETYLPPAMHQTPVLPSLAAARQEAEMVMFESVEQVLSDHKVSPKQVDILIVNCSLFGPTPSLAAMIINRFKMRSNITSYNLGGMGCSAGLISISLAREMMQVYSNVNVLVVSTENITQNWYFGNKRSHLIPNCLFRLGGAAILLSNKRSDARRAQYQLQSVVRTHLGADNDSYGCVIQQEDEEGHVGVHLGKELMDVAGRALKQNITSLGPRVLPLSEKLRFVANFVQRKVLKRQLKTYIPSFEGAFQHVCIHTGGRGVIDAIEKALQLPGDRMEASRATLYRYGNISSASTWYVLANIETFKGVRKGERVWQISFGSGFKCNSAVWKACRLVNKKHEAWIE